VSGHGIAGGQAPRRIMIVSCPELRDAGPGSRAAHRHERMVTVVTGFCPDVEVVEPGVCAFGARGPSRYFGGETALATRIITALAEPSIRIGVADGLFAARLAADGQAGAGAQDQAGAGAQDQAGAGAQDQAGAGAQDQAGAGAQDQVTVVPPGGTPAFLAGQPVSVLADQDRDLSGLLKRLGLGTLGDFAALPAVDVASRFGDLGERAHRLARGLDPRPLAARPPPADLSVTQEFDPPEPRAEPVVFAAKALAGRLHDGLAARGLTCVRVQVAATWADGRESSRRWRHDGLLSAAAVAERVRWQLDGGPPVPESDQEKSSQETIGGVAILRLTPDQLVRDTGQQLALWGESVVSDRVARAALRVQALLGHEAVLRPLVGGGRNVWDQVTSTPFGEKREPSLAGDRPWPGRVMGPAPGLVFPAARAADVTDDAGNPVTVSGRCAISGAPARLAVRGEPPRRVTGWAGPWPLSERWWDPSAARRRARFQLVTDDGRAWLAVVEGGRWLVEAGYWLWAGRTRRSPGGNCSVG
jgi:protein ImuB